MPNECGPWPSSISLQAVDPKRNIARHYQIEISTDLFGLWVVEYRWGRIGTVGQARQASFLVAGEAQEFVSLLIRRRAGAQRRIGVSYHRMDEEAEQIPYTHLYDGRH
jgi:predicted DNA-binding WGR domain protein